MWKILVLLLVFTGCSFGPGNFQSRQTTDLEQRRIKRIAVLPPSAFAPVQKSRVPFTTDPAAEAKPSEKDAPELLAKLIYVALASTPNWQIVSDTEVRDVAQSIPQVNEASRLRKLGEMVFADAVLTARVLRYRERIGEEWGAKSPASVAFVLELWDIRRGDIIWQARFDETQKSLSENIFAIGEISRRGVKWLSAEQLMNEGVKKAVAQLHQTLHRSPA